MDKKTFMKRVILITAIVVSIVMLVIGLCFGKIVEETLFGEIAKWIVGTLFIIVIVEVCVFPIAGVYYPGSRFDPTSEKYKKLHNEKE